MKPLEVMFSSYLNRSGFGEGEMCGWAIEGTMVILAMGQIRMESSKLSVRPPVSLSSKCVYEVQGTREKGALRKV